MSFQPTELCCCNEYNISRFCRDKYLHLRSGGGSAILNNEDIHYERPQGSPDSFAGDRIQLQNGLLTTRKANIGWPLPFGSAPGYSGPARDNY